jgi:chemotaxis protein MotB
MRTLRAAARLAVVAAALAVLALAAGCSSCKEFKARITELDAQVADLQSQLTAKDGSLGECQKLADELRANLKKCEADKDVLVKQVNEVVMVRVPERLLFKSGSDQVRSEMKSTLETIASSIGQRPDWDVFVEGHTDDKLIKNEYLERWASNWELGAYRACAVVRYFTGELKLDPKRFAAVSYGPYRPLDTNDTPDGRANNRFVQIVMHKPAK